MHDQPTIAINDSGMIRTRTCVHRTHGEMGKVGQQVTTASANIPYTSRQALRVVAAGNSC